MTKSTTAKKPKAPKENPHPDGRRERSRSSRAKIVAALLKLVAEGEISPSAARVAETAGVGLRSVFRHFDDMDALYREMSDEMEAKILPMLKKPYESDDWRSQLLELADRSAKVFDMMMPYRISANIKRFQSEYLMEDYKRILKLENDQVGRILPPAVKADRVRAKAIMLTVSFNSWRRLRYDEGMSAKASKAVIIQMLEDILSRIQD